VRVNLHAVGGAKAVVIKIRLLSCTKTDLLAYTAHVEHDLDLTVRDGMDISKLFIHRGTVVESSSCAAPLGLLHITST
jgi:hypothetical protein